MPNCGKSSLINSLKRSKACAVGDESGITKHSQLIKLDAYCSMLDSPGVIHKDHGGSSSLAVLRNATHSKVVEDPIKAVEHLVQVISEQVLCKVYKLPAY